MPIKIPASSEIEKLRLLLSTFQDGTGQLAQKKDVGTLPGWRDFERSVALAFGGEAQENKAIFDILIHDGNTYRGISCKMRCELKHPRLFWNCRGTPHIWGCVLSKAPIALDIEVKPLKNMAYSADAITTPHESFDFGVQTFNEATTQSGYKVVCDFFEPVCQSLQEGIEALQATTLNFGFPYCEILNSLFSG